jgi:hypothetical protein
LCRILDGQRLEQQILEDRRHHQHHRGTSLERYCALGSHRRERGREKKRGGNHKRQEQRGGEGRGRAEQETEQGKAGEWEGREWEAGRKRYQGNRIL